MLVSVATLNKTSRAQLTFKFMLSKMSLQMISHVAKLRKFLSALQTPQNLIVASTLGVEFFDFFIKFFVLLYSLCVSYFAHSHAILALKGRLDLILSLTMCRLWRKVLVVSQFGTLQIFMRLGASQMILRFYFWEFMLNTGQFSLRRIYF